MFRELLQNSDDAGCDLVEIRFETVVFSGLDSKDAKDASLPVIAHSMETNVHTAFDSPHCRPTNTSLRLCNGRSETTGSR